MVVPPASSVSEGVSPPGVSGPGFWPDTSDVGWGVRLDYLVTSCLWDGLALVPGLCDEVSYSSRGCVLQPVIVT